MMKFLATAVVTVSLAFPLFSMAASDGAGKEPARAAGRAKPPAKAPVAKTRQKTKSVNVRSQAEKRLEQQRKDMTRNWGG